MNAQPAVQAPLRLLVGANMPAALIEMGFLTNADDERALNGAASGAIVEAIIATVNDLRSGFPAPAPSPAPVVK
jgi:N-acetylmuramoyl-L-alanine amidase